MDNSLRYMREHRDVIIRGVNEFNKYSEIYSWLTTLWLSKINQFNVQLVGHRGTGKSRSMRALPIKYFGEDTVTGDGGLVHYISGHRTPLKFYIEMYQHHNSLIAVEEAEVLQADKQISDMFRNGFYHPFLFEWQTSKPIRGIPPSFKFNGSVCLATNGLGGLTNAHMAASYDRFFIANLAHTKHEIREKQRAMWSDEQTTPWLIGMTLRLLELRVHPEKAIPLSPGDYELLDSILDLYYSKEPIKGENPEPVSVRDAERIENLAFHLKSLFGTLEDEPIVNLLTDIFFSLGIEPKGRIWHNRKLFNMR